MPQRAGLPKLETAAGNADRGTVIRSHASTAMELPNIPVKMIASVWGRDKRRTPMMNLKTTVAPWRAGVLASIAWAVGGALDGASLSELLTVPIIVAAWISIAVLMDRWVRKGINQE
jgi:hypothetical protein